ncbi:MAG: integrase family protein [Gammaproteobacteria bacterium]|nr:integrase family protein [Gammaproteobacteria bacterium]
MPESISLIFTKSALAQLEPRDRRYYVYDRGSAKSVSGLVMSITPKGTKSFLVYRKLNGRPKRVKLGRFPAMTVEQARQHAIQAIAKLCDGVDVIRERRSQRSRHITLAQVLGDYCRDRSLKPSTEAMYRGRLAQYLSDWMNRRLDYITRDRVADRHQTITKTSATSANKVMRVLRAIFEYAAGEYFDECGRARFPDNPVRQLSHRRIWNKETRRDSRLSTQDLPAWFGAVRQLDNVWRDYLILVLLTGLRRREADSLRWDNINLREGTLTVLETKNGDPHTLPLSDYLLSILEQRRVVSQSPWVFPSRIGSRTGHIQEPSKAVQHVRKLASVHFTIHDLRRTFISVAETVNVGGYTLKRLLNHRVRSDVTDGYIVLSEEELRIPMQRITDTIVRAAHIRKGDVVPLFNYPRAS